MNLDEQRQRAEIAKIKAETRKIIAETEKIIAETEKTAAETEKTAAETEKIQRDAKWYFLAILTALAALFAKAAETLHSLFK